MGDVAAELCVLSTDRCDVCDNALETRRPPFHVCRSCFERSTKVLAAEGIAHVVVDMDQLLRDGEL